MELEEGYRRGTVLGLTIAEIFVLLVFLMLLALLGVNRHWSEKLDPWTDIIARTTPAEVEDALKLPDELRRDIEALRRQVAELKEEKESLQNRIRMLVAREGHVGKELEETKQRLAAQERALEDARRRIEGLVNANRATTIAADELRKKLGAQTKSNSDLSEEIADLNDKIRIIGKGTTPPCWYRIVEETDPSTKANRRERPYYLFDIVIREEHMEIQRAPIPEGRAEDDDGGPYSEEARALGLDAMRYGEPLTDEDVLDLTRRLFDMGKASKVRTYSCIFHVRVWDETPVSAKGRWKQAHDYVLERRFGTYQVQDFGWSERDENPANVPDDLPGPDQ